MAILDWLVEHDFLDEDRARQVRDIADDRSLARELIQRDWLTPYQANQILTGKGDTLVLGPYRLLERLGEGSMGQVYKGWNTRLGRFVAVKMIHKEHLDSKRAMDRFRREMETAAQLDHPNIVLVRDADEVDSRPFLVMDLVEGSDLARLVKHNGPLPIHQACEFGRQVALGLQHAFERGVVHRDIKPSNLLVTKSSQDQTEIVKILDFGLARFDDERGVIGRLTQVGAVLGTVDFIAPEQAENATTADTRCDIYSLGCTLFYVLAGTPPFAGASLVEKISARRTSEAPSICRFRADAPSGLEEVLRKMLARMPDARYQTPQEVAAALQPFTVPLAQPVKSELELSLPELVVSEEEPPSRSTERFAFELGSAPASPASPSVLDETQDTFPTAATSANAVSTNVKSRQKAPRATATLRHLWVWLGVGFLVVSSVVLLLLIGKGGGAKKDLYPADAELHLNLRNDESVFQVEEGKSITLIVRVERTGFHGPVDITLEGLPDGIRAEKSVIALEKTEAEIRITVSYQTANQQVDAFVVATAKNVKDRRPVTLKVNGRR